MLEVHIRNHHRHILGIKLIAPLLIIRLRLPVRSYKTLTKKNIPEEHRPCPNITPYAPLTPHQLKITNPQRVSPMCATEEYATKDFISTCRRHRIPTRAPPTPPAIMINHLKLTQLVINILATIIKPYPPSFSKTPAKIIEPATGAST